MVCFRKPNFKNRVQVRSQRDTKEKEALFPNLIIPIPLFFPWIGMVVIASRFPEARLVLFHQANAAHPLSALPKIQVRYHHPGRATMFWRKRFPIIFQSDKGLTVDHIRERYVCGVASIAKGSDEQGVPIQVSMFEQCIKADALPLHVEMSPLGDTGNIHNISLHGELEKFLPCPLNSFLDEAFDGKCPLVEGRTRRRSRGEDRKIIREILTGWDAVLFFSPSPFPKKTTRYKPFLRHNNASFTSKWLGITTPII